MAESSLVRMPYQRYLDGLRCVSVSWVILYHLKLPDKGIVGLICDRGWMGVGMFFVISGFLITSILLNEYTETGAICLRRFYMRRILRLWPAYYLLISLTLLYSIVLLSLHRDSAESSLILHTIKWPALYLENIYLSYTGAKRCTLLHSWSLCLEEQFYLLWSVILVLSVRRAKWIAALSILAIAAWRTWLTFHLPPGPPTVSRTYDAPDTRMDVILCGCVLAYILADKIQAERLGRLLARWWVPIILLIAFVAVLCINNRWSGHLGNSVGYTLGAVTMTSALAYLHTTRPEWLMALLESNPLVYVGRISYGVYLFHPAVIYIGTKIVRGLNSPWHQLELIVLAYGGGIAVAAISYKYIESSFLRMKVRFSPRRSAQNGGLEQVATV